MTLATFLLYKGRLGGAIGLSGAMCAEVDWSKIEGKEKTPLFLYHGLDDPVVPHELATLTYEVFKEKKFNFTYEIEQNLVHSLSIVEIKKVAKFINTHMI